MITRLNVEIVTFKTDGLSKLPRTVAKANRIGVRLKGWVSGVPRAIPSSNAKLPSQHLVDRLESTVVPPEI